MGTDDEDQPTGRARFALRGAIPAATGWPDCSNDLTSSLESVYTTASDEQAMTQLPQPMQRSATINGVACVAFTSMALTGHIRTQAYDCLHLSSKILTSAIRCSFPISLNGQDI